MRKLFLLFICFSPIIVQAQLKIALKAGLNFANVTNAESINSDTRTGYMIGGYISPSPKKLLGFRSEIILSRQGYDYKTNTNSGKVDLDYLLLPQLITLNFTKKFQVHAGGQAAFLLNASVDSTGNDSPGSLLGYFNRFDYGVVAGAEVSPLLGLFFGGRINVSLGNVSEDGNRPNFIPGIDSRNNVFQLYLGWRL